MMYLHVSSLFQLSFICSFPQCETEIRSSLEYSLLDLLFHMPLNLQFSSLTQSCATLCNPMDCSMPGFPVHHQLLELTQTHIHRWWHPTISSSVIPFSPCLQSFPASGSFPMSQFFTSGGQSIGVSASTSVLPKNSQDWFPWGLIGSPRDSQESSPTPQFKSINSLELCFLYRPILTSIHDYWKKP